MRLSAQIGLAALSVVLLSLAFAPWGLFFLAWVALAPWLIVITNVGSVRRAFLIGWASGIAFFALNLAWMSNATYPGTVAACVALGLSWGLVAAAIRWTDLTCSPALAVLFIAATWCAGEWLRAIAVGGFSWLLLGHTQSRFVLLCQIADTTGVYGISFYLAAVNALVALAIQRRPIRRAAIAVAVMLVVTIAYGIWRMNQSGVLTPGPRVMVVQSNITYARGGVPSQKREEIADLHFRLTQKALILSVGPPDLIVWSEAMMPPLNDEARHELRRAGVGPFLLRTHERISLMATEARAGGLITGGYYVGGWKSVGVARVGDDRRNSAYFYTSDGTLASSRYDKIELVPFAETMPWPSAPAWIKSTMLWLAAPNAREPDTPGKPNALTVFGFPNNGPRFITPICFENVDAPFIARMLRGTRDAPKRADFIVNLTNDGWFWEQEHAQHLQAIVFRAIENRVPIARASNTGISGFIDSLGRLRGALAADSEGTMTQAVMLDRRNTLYTRFGDGFAVFCTLFAVAMITTKRIRRR